MHDSCFYWCMPMSGISADSACRLILHKLERFKLKHEVIDTAHSIVICVKKTKDEVKLVKGDDVKECGSKSLKKIKFGATSSEEQYQCEVCHVRKNTDFRMSQLQEELRTKQNENNTLQNDIKQCQTEIIRMLKEEVASVKEENDGLKHELQMMRKLELSRRKLQLAFKNRHECLNLEQIRNQILYGEAPTCFQRYDN